MIRQRSDPRDEAAKLDTAKLSGEEIASTLDKLKAAFDAGSLSMPPVREWKFDQAADAYRNTAAGQSAKKNVIVMK